MCRILFTRNEFGQEMIQTYCHPPVSPYWAEHWESSRQDRVGGPLYEFEASLPTDPREAAQERANRAYVHDTAPMWVRRERLIPRW